jgi:hypothetical protein
MWVYGVVFFVIAFYGFGKVDAKGVGIVAAVGGVMNVIFAMILIGASLIGFYTGGLVEPVAMVGLVTALLVFHFGIPALTVGFGNLFGVIPRGASFAAIFIGIFILLYIPFFMSHGMFWFAANCLLWSWVIFSFLLVVFGKLNPKVMAWSFLILSFVTCFIPAGILFLGAPLP